MLSRSITILLLVVLIELTQVTVANKHEPDCLYNRCEYKIAPWKYIQHVPCLDTSNRQLVRDVDCDDGNTYHICCKMPYRQDIQRSRQNWFRAVTAIGGSISQSCMQRMLCEQACLDGLNGAARADYPQLMPTEDDDEDRKYLEAWNRGENQACYGLMNQPGKAIKYTTDQCVHDCDGRYAACQSEMEHSLVLKVYYLSSRTFHRLGMWVFTVLHRSIDMFNDYIRRAVEVQQAMMEVFYKWHQRMVKAERQFEEFLSHLRKQRSAADGESDSTRELEWKRFLEDYNKTDSDLVMAVYDSLTYDNFTQAISVINETLVSLNFTPPSSPSSAASNLISFYLLVFILVLTIFFIGERFQL